ncbi:hypothetical protein [Bacillus sp. mrc49]|uniref:hypothetical protein n=1 Tax=Bacillus sp. mrc49 TaxID=2054913 RepID=UPI0012FDEBE4|nr:hypothetical protein [Bacillus sp. mrc49]
MEAEILYEEENGYPTFKEGIAKELAETFDVPLSDAFKVIFSNSVQAKIDRDIEWSQHMGISFWAEEINKHFSKLQALV